MCYMADCMKYSISLSMLLYFNIVILFHNMVQAMKLRQDDKTNYFRPQRAPVFDDWFYCSADQAVRQERKKVTNQVLIL